MVPFHPLITHFPMALTFILPILIIVWALMIKSNKMSPKSWLIIIGLQMVLVVTGYVSLETGENEEHTVAKFVSKDLVHQHEEAAEIFVGSTVLGLVLSIGAFFLRKESVFKLQIALVGLGVISCYLAYQTGKLGGELVYKHGAAAAYADGVEAQPLPDAPLKETPSSDNESLKPDENDYGNADEVVESPDEELKQED